MSQTPHPHDPYGTEPGSVTPEQQSPGWTAAPQDASAPQDAPEQQGLPEQDLGSATSDPALHPHDPYAYDDGTRQAPAAGDFTAPSASAGQDPYGAPAGGAPGPQGQAGPPSPYAAPGQQGQQAGPGPTGDSQGTYDPLNIDSPQGAYDAQGAPGPQGEYGPPPYGQPGQGGPPWSPYASPAGPRRPSPLPAIAVVTGIASTRPTDPTSVRMTSSASSPLVMLSRNGRSYSETRISTGSAAPAYAKAMV